MFDYIFYLFEEFKLTILLLAITGITFYLLKDCNFKNSEQDKRDNLMLMLIGLLSKK